MTDVLGVTDARGVFLFILYAFIHVSILVLTVSLVVRLVRYLRTATKDRKLLRMELGKLAEEVRLMREEADGSGTRQ